jgi:hypothetical protein
LTDFDSNLTVYNMDGCAYDDVHNFRANGEKIHKKKWIEARRKKETAKMAVRGPTAGNRQSRAGTGKVNGMMGGSCGTSRHAGLASIGRGTGITTRQEFVLPV